jgi:hypothetical protein
MNSGKIANCIFCLKLSAFIAVIALLTVSRATAGAAEALDSSVLYFAQLADGGGYITQVMLSNPGVTDVTATLEAFKTATGTPLTVTFNGVTSSSFTWKIKSHGSLFLKSAGAGAQPETGWIRVQATGKLGGSLIYSYFSGGKAISEAGFDPSAPLTDFSLTVETRKNYYSGLAVANPNSTPLEVRYVLYDGDGNWRAQSSQPLGAMEHRAKLIEEIFPGKIPTDFTGSVTASSSGGAVIATTLRFNDESGAMASVPVTAGFPAAAPPTGVEYTSLSGRFYLASTGEITQLRANANSRDGFLQDVTNQAIWKSSNPAIASVSPTGLVTAVAPGLVEIIATYGSFDASAGISVATPVDLNGKWNGSSFSSAGSLSWSGTITQVRDSVSIASTAQGNGLYYTALWSGTVNGASIFSSGSLNNAGGTVCSWNDGRCVANSKELKCVTPMMCVTGFTLSTITATRP